MHIVIIWKHFIITNYLSRRTAHALLNTLYIISFHKFSSRCLFWHVQFDSCDFVCFVIKLRRRHHHFPCMKAICEVWIYTVVSTSIDNITTLKITWQNSSMVIIVLVGIRKKIHAPQTGCWLTLCFDDVCKSKQLTWITLFSSPFFRGMNRIQIMLEMRCLSLWMHTMKICLTHVWSWR